MKKTFRRWCALLFVALCVIVLPLVSRAQSGGAPPPPPPPPPAEGLDPGSAPATSTGQPVQGKPAADNPPPPPPPTEGLDPNAAPSGSTGPANATAASGTHTPDDGHDHADHDATEGMTVDNSLGAVFGLDFMRRALWVGLVVSGVCAYLGVYVVLRRVVFVGVALSQMSSAGVALSLLVSGMSPMIGSVLTMLIGVGLLSVRWGGRRIRQDAYIGIGYAVAAAAAILLVAKSPKGEGDLLSVLFGNILTVVPEEAKFTALALAAVLAFHLLFYKELLFVSFDPDTASAAGYPSRLWELLLYVSVGLAIAFAIHAVGVLLPFAALVIPAVGALLITRRMTTALITSVILGMIPVPLGLYLSFVSGLPSGEAVVAVSFGLLLLVGAYTKLRGTAL